MNPLEVLANDIPHLQSSLQTQYVVPGLSNFIVWMFIVLAVVLIVVLLSGRRLQLIPTNKFTNMVEYGYEMVRKQIGEDAIGHGYKRHIPFLATLFFFILISNIIGLIPGCKTPTGTISVTWALSLISFVYFNYWGVKAHGGWGYIKSIAPSGLPKVMVPVICFFEFISLVLRALTLAVRLYGNMFAGHMVLGIFALATYVFIESAIQTGNFMYFLPPVGWMLLLIVMYALECLVAFLQAYVFTILSAVYISLATSEH